MILRKPRSGLWLVDAMFRAEGMSLRACSQETGIPVATISANLKRAEAEWGFPLLEIEDISQPGSPKRLSKYGECLAEACQPFFREWERVCVAMDELRADFKKSPGAFRFANFAAVRSGDAVNSMVKTINEAVKQPAGLAAAANSEKSESGTPSQE